MSQQTFVRSLTSLSVATLLTLGSPALAHETPVEAANKKVVLDFYQALMAADASGTKKTKIRGIAEKYLSPEYIQHSDAFAGLPGPGGARDKLIRMFETMPPMPPLPPAKTLAVMAEGDRVMMLTAREQGPAGGSNGPLYIFNMFRVKNGQLIEHWDVGTPMPPGSGPPLADKPAQ